jgi:hypothetical protein
MMKKITLYAEISKENLYDIGEKAELSESALKMFIHFNEIPITVLVNSETGVVHAWYSANIIEK